MGQVTSQELIVGLPLNGRSATQLLLLQGGAVEGGVTTGNRGFPGQVAISVAGGTGNSTQYLVDGGYNNEPQSNAGSAIPFPDALQEFRTESGVRDARFGMSTGATVNAVTKSGTNAVPRQCVRLHAPSHVQCDQLLRKDGERRSRSRRRSEAQPVRRNDRRADPEGQVVLLLWRPR